MEMNEQLKTALLQEAEQAKTLFEHTAHKQTQPSEHPFSLGLPIRRLSIETDGVTARMRRESVEFEEAEAKPQGDVYREMKVERFLKALLGVRVRS